MKHLFVLRAFKSALAAVLIISLVSCGGDKEDAASGPAPTSVGVPQVPTAAISGTQADLAKFWEKYGGREKYPAEYADVVESALKAEDLVFAKDYKGARAIVDMLLAKYPYSNGKLWEASNIRFDDQGIYSHIRMLDEITKVGVSKPMLGAKALKLTVVAPACADYFPRTGSNLFNHRLSPDVEANDFEVVRKHLRLFQSYILAITGGEARLEVNVHKLDWCYKIPAEGVNSNYNEPIYNLPDEVRNTSDMFWVMYPHEHTLGIDITAGGGMGTSDNYKPVFINSDDFFTKRRETEVEHRLYLPRWIQHEFFHNLFMTFWEDGLEKSDHQWFDRNTWPADFVGHAEEDYYSEALNKRFYKASPGMAQRLKKSP